MEYNPFRGALIVSIIVIIYGLLWHTFQETTKNYGLVIMWLPVYIAPLWIVAGISWLSERKKNKN